MWEWSLACLVNLSHLHQYRPMLGNAGFVVAITEKARQEEGEELSEREAAHCVTALCLFCRESVNRMKLRECGGLRLFVRLLGDPSKSRLHDRVINSLLQYSYDDASLLVLQEEGLVPKLIDLLDAYVEVNGTDHDCAREICQGDDEDKMSSVHEEEEEEEVGEEPSLQQAAAEADSVEEQQENVEGAKSPEVEEKESVDAEIQAAENKDDSTPKDSEPVAAGPSSTPPRLYRVNSPSYQAVQHEFEEYLRIQDEMKRQQSAQPFSTHFPDVPWSSDSPGCSRWQSPDRSPASGWALNSPGYSPMHSPMSGASSEPASPDRSFASSPPGSPMSVGAITPPYPPTNEQESSSLPTQGERKEEEGAEEKEEDKSKVTFEYSPVETFSDDDKEDEAASASGPSVVNPQTDLSSPPPEKRRRLTSSGSAKLVLPSHDVHNQRRSIFSPTYETSFNDYFNGALSSSPSSSPPRNNEAADYHMRQWRPIQRPSTSKGAGLVTGAEDSRVGWILQILSRLSQAERPHEDMAALRTTQVLVRYLARIKDPIPRAGRILARLSK